MTGQTDDDKKTPEGGPPGREEPWWRRASSVTAVVALISGVLPATTAIQSCNDKEREVELERTKLDHELKMQQQKLDEDIRAQYLDRVRDPRERRRVLRFLRATSNDESVRKWADDEMAVVDDEATKLDAESQARQTEADKAWQAAIAAATDKDNSAQVKLALAQSKQATATAARQGLIGALNGDGHATQSLAERLTKDRAQLHRCTDAGGTLEACLPKTHLVAASLPKDEDIERIRTLEARLSQHPDDLSAFNELRRDRAMFIRRD